MLRTRDPLLVVAAAAAAFVLLGSLTTLAPLGFLQAIGVAMSVLAAGALLTAVYVVLVVD